jgi:hypothetical protein
VEKVEQWLVYGTPKPGMPTGTRRDAFGFIDILAIDADAIVAIQACTASGAKHLRKIQESEYADAWLRAGGRIELWIWRKVKLKRGGKAVRWRARVEQVTAETLNAGESIRGGDG